MSFLSIGSATFVGCKYDPGAPQSEYTNLLEAITGEQIEGKLTDDRIEGIMKRFVSEKPDPRKLIAAIQKGVARLPEEERTRVRIEHNTRPDGYYVSIYLDIDWGKDGEILSIGIYFPRDGGFEVGSSRIYFAG